VQSEGCYLLLRTEEFYSVEEILFMSSALSIAASVCSRIAGHFLLLWYRRKFEPGDKVTFSTKEQWCKVCTAEADGTKSPSSPEAKKLTVPLSVSPPKPPRVHDAVDSEGLGLTPSTDKSLSHASSVLVISPLKYFSGEAYSDSIVIVELSI